MVLLSACNIFFSHLCNFALLLLLQKLIFLCKIYFLLTPTKTLCFVVCLFACLLATLHKNFVTDLHEILREGGQWANEQIIKFLW